MALNVERRWERGAGNAFRIGHPPLRFEIITEATGIEFEVSYAGSTPMAVDGHEIPFLSYPDLVRKKQASGRLRDKADLEALNESPDPAPENG